MLPNVGQIIYVFWNQKISFEKPFLLFSVFSFLLPSLSMFKNVDLPWSLPCLHDIVWLYLVLGKLVLCGLMSFKFSIFLYLFSV